MQAILRGVPAARAGRQRGVWRGGGGHSRGGAATLLQTQGQVGPPQHARGVLGLDFSHSHQVREQEQERDTSMARGGRARNGLDRGVSRVSGS